MHFPTLLLISLPWLLNCDSSSKPEQKPDLDIDAASCTSPGTAAEAVACVDKTRLVADITEIAKERVPGSPHWQSVQDLCKDRLDEYGYEVELVDYGTGVNVIGRRAGSDSTLGEVIVSAHYDHITGCPGASDNAAGVAVTLEMARHLAGRTNKHPLVIACWDEEERGLIGSRAYADNAVAQQQNIAAMIVFDTIGFLSNEENSQTLPPGFDMLFPDEAAEVAANGNRGDFLSIISDEASSTLVDRIKVHGDAVGLKISRLDVPEALKLIPATSSLRRSDHASFWVNEFPAIMFNDTANFRNPNYHCLEGVDSPDTLDMEFVLKTTQAALGGVIDILEQ